jgi:ribonuclease P protein component
VLPKAYRLRRAADLARVRQHGRRWRHPLVTLIVYQNPGAEAMGNLANDAESYNGPPASRFAVVAGREVGPAVRRNRAKRRLRAIVRGRLEDIRPGWDCLLIARPPVVEASFAEVESAIRQLFARAGVSV